MVLSSELSCEAGSFSAATSTPTGIFNQWFGALFPQAGTLGCAVCFSPPLSLWVYLYTNVGPRGLLAITLPAPFVPQSASLWVQPHCHESRPPWLPVSDPPTGLDECFFFNSLVVGLLCGSIFCQFWLFFVFKLLLSFFWFCEEAQCVYLRLHLEFSPISFPNLIFLMQTLLNTLFADAVSLPQHSCSSPHVPLIFSPMARITYFPHVQSLFSFFPTVM